MNPPLALRVHHFEPFSRANGPGLRCVLWVQGCTLGCPGCFNPETHPAKAGSLVPIEDIARQVLDLQGQVEGLSISGGEPLQQLAAVQALIHSIKEESSLSILIFSGFTLEEIRRLPGSVALLKDVDVLLAGRYRQEQRLGRGLVGSTNKTLHFLSPRYTPSDLIDIPEAEVIIASDGTVTLSGIHPLGAETLA